MDSNDYAKIQEAVGAALEAGEHRWCDVLDEFFSADDPRRAQALDVLQDTSTDAGMFSDASIERQRTSLEKRLENPLVGEQWRPDAVGPYEILDLIGRGGSGVVFKARQARPRRDVALKLLSPSFATTETIERLHLEAEILGRLQHAGIAAIFESGIFDGGFGEQPYFAMELVEGKNLIDHATGGQLNRRERVELVIRVLDAIEYAHGRGVVHRDLKPDNILVTPEGVPKVLDFGIARVESSTLASGLTRDGQLLGTVAYMPPEQVRGGPSSGARADVFSIGMIAFELLTGARARLVEGMSVTEMLREIDHEVIPRARSVDSSIERDLDVILGKAVEQRPADRYSSAGAFANDLRRFLQDLPIAARPPSVVDRSVKFVRRHRSLVAGTLATGAVLIAGIAGTSFQARRAMAAESDTERQLYAADMLLASAMSMDPTSGGRSRSRVDRWRPGAPTARAIDETGELRWEWHLLDSLERTDTLVLPCMDGAMSVSWHPSGDYVAVAMETSVGVFDARTGAQVAGRSLLEDFNGHIVIEAGWSPDGTLVAVRGALSLCVWEPFAALGENESAREDALPPRGTVHFLLGDVEYASATWSPDGERLLCLFDNAVIHDAHTGEVLGSSPHRITGMRSTTRDPATGMGLAHTVGGGLALFDTETADVAEELVHIGVGVATADLGVDGSRIYAGCFDAAVRAFDRHSGELLWTFTGFDDTLQGCAAHPHRSDVLIASTDGTVRLLDGATGEQLDVYNGGVRPASDVEWSPDGTRFASAHSGGRARIWNADEKSAVRRIIPGPKAPDVDCLGRISWDDSRQHLWVAHHWRTSVWDWRAETRVTNLATAGIAKVAPGGRAAASVVGHTSIEIVQANARDRDESVFDSVTRTFGEDTSSVMAWFPSGEGIAVSNVSGIYTASCAGGTLGPPIKVHDAGIQATDIACSPNGEFVCASSTYEWVWVVHAKGGRPAIELKLPERSGARCVSWSPDSDELAVGTTDGQTYVFERTTGVHSKSLVGHAGRIEAVAWHPSGDRIATSGRDRTVKLWSAKSGALVASFPCEAIVVDLLWIEAGRVLVALDKDGGLTVWDASRSLSQS